MTKRLARTVLYFGVFALALGASASAANFTPGSPGLGDPMFPNAGNGGYDVQHYGLTLDYTPSSNQLTATAVISARQRRIFRASISTCGGSRSRGCSLTAEPRPSRATAGRS